ncbi:MAG TPA: EamA family transporter [Rhizomicrobium sp.]|nr:EamA family transporter [Rhizomicrobium sp.]
MGRASGPPFSATVTWSGWPVYGARRQTAHKFSQCWCGRRQKKLGPASGVAPVDKMSVLLVALFAVLFLGERLQVHNWIGIVLIALGVVLVALQG